MSRGIRETLSNERAAIAAHAGVRRNKIRKRSSYWGSASCSRIYSLTGVAHHHVSPRDQRDEHAILVGTDFNDGVKGIGKKKALTLVQQHGRIEHMPEEIRQALGDPHSLDEIRHIFFLHPDVLDIVEMPATAPDIDGIVNFLCDEREFSRERVGAALERAFREPTLW